MSFFTWDEKFSVRIQRIDTQHQQLFVLFERLTHAMEKGKGGEILGDILHELLKYTRTHFITEEQLLKMYGYPDYETHKNIHDELTRKVQELNTRFHEGSALSVTTSIFLRDWLMNHILKTDMQYAAFLHEKGVN